MGVFVGSLTAAILLGWAVIRFARRHAGAPLATYPAEETDRLVG